MALCAAVLAILCTQVSAIHTRGPTLPAGSSIQSLVSLGSTFFNAVLQEGIRQTKDPKNELLLNRHMNEQREAQTIDKTYGFSISYTTESADGSQWKLEYDKGCDHTTSTSNDCFFPLGTTVHSHGVLDLASEVGDDGTFDIETVYHFRGFLQGIFGLLLKAPIKARCPACGEQCSRSALPGGLRSMIKEIQVPINPCPLLPGPILFEDNITTVEDNFQMRTIDFDNEFTETLRTGKGDLVFKTSVKMAMGPRSSEGKGGSWVRIRGPTNSTFSPTLQ
jgi:hypothetical protein